MTQRKKISDPNGVTDKDDIDEIESNIERTREAISEDLREIGGRLTPEHIKAEVKHEVKQVAAEAKDAAAEKMREVKDAATETLHVAGDKLRDVGHVAGEKLREAGHAASETVSHAMDTVSEKMDDVRMGARRASDATVGFVRENAVPLALLGIGTAWLIANQRSGRDRWTPPRGASYARDWDDDRLVSGDTSTGSTAGGSGASRIAERARERASGAVDEVRRGFGRASEKTSQLASRAEQRAHDLAGRAEHAISESTHRARLMAEREMHRARDLAETNPLALGAAALVAGVGIGLLLPMTNKENELLGPTRDRLVDGAKETVHELEQAAKDLGSTAKETAREMKNGLSGSMAGH